MTSRTRRLWWAAVVTLLMTLAVELFVPAHEQSQTPDEANHLLGGVRSWKYGDFGTNPEHPPFAKLVAALPVLGVPSPPAVKYTQYFKSENFSKGAEFLYTHDADGMLWRSRAAVSVFTFLLALLVLAAGSEIFGPSTGLVALLIFVFEPNLLAHGAMVTTDMAGGMLFLRNGLRILSVAKTSNRLAGHDVWNRRRPGAGAKHSGLFLAPVLLALALIDVLATSSVNKTGRNGWRKDALIRLSRWPLQALWPMQLFGRSMAFATRHGLGI